MGLFYSQTFRQSLFTEIQLKCPLHSPSLSFHVCESTCKFLMNNGHVMIRLYYCLYECNSFVCKLFFSIFFFCVCSSKTTRDRGRFPFHEYLVTWFKSVLRKHSQQITQLNMASKIKILTPMK